MGWPGNTSAAFGCVEFQIRAHVVPTGSGDRSVNQIAQRFFVSGFGIRLLLGPPQPVVKIATAANAVRC